MSQRGQRTAFPDSISQDLYSPALGGLKHLQAGSRWNEYGKESTWPDRVHPHILLLHNIEQDERPLLAGFSRAS